MCRVSVVMPTHNRLGRLKEVIRGLEQQAYPLNDVEVIIVSDGSTDGTNNYLTNLQTQLRLRPVIQANAGPAAARNSGIAQATGEIVLFLDDDVVPHPQLIAEHLRIHDEQPNSVVLGPMLNPHNFRLLPWVSWEQAMLKKQYDAMQRGLYKPTARQFFTGNTSLPRQLLEQAGGFDERFRRAEDLELAYRLDEHGARFTFNPLAIGYHFAERSFRSWLETPYAYGRNDVVFAQEKRQSWLLPTMKYEFSERNLLIRIAVHTCLDRSMLTKGIIQACRHIATIGSRVGLDRVVQMAYSAIFNLRYYQGVADGLGGRNRFLSEVGNDR
jgi:GT2 family glycosyltransferase